MPNNEDYRKYLDTRFEGLVKVMSAQFINVHDKLDAIEKQTTKTTGRVNELEAKESNHIINCPVAAKVERIDEDLTEYRMLKKYPKLGISIVACLVLGLFVTLYKVLNKQDVMQVGQDNLKKQVDMINTPVTDKRTGKVYLYPSGVKIDSVITK